MRNSNTLGEALEYVVKHSHAYTPAARIYFEPDHANQKVLVGHEILLERLLYNSQATEQTMLLGALNAVEITGGQARVREVHFRHQPLVPLRTYRDYFGCEVRFDQKVDGVVFKERDLLCPIVNANTRLHEMAKLFIDTKITRVTPGIHAVTRSLILQHLGGEQCTNEQISEKLGLHPRTLHRRLQAEGKSFEVIKDEVRREAALRYLEQTDMPLMQVTERLGYAEASVFTRSCFRWFASSPSQVRARARLPVHQDRQAVS
jgi:AraC-like DNA-binding protein